MTFLPADRLPRLGLQTYGEVAERDGLPESDAATIRELVWLGQLAERHELDSFAIAEHHRADFPVSAPDMVLATLAGLTSNLRLGSALSELATDDPVRIYQRFATLDALSDGRAFVTLGRSPYTENFALFGCDPGDYDKLFAERLNLWASLCREEAVSWVGQTRTALANQPVYPRTLREPGRPIGLETWVSASQNPQSVLRAARYGFHLMFVGLELTPAVLAQHLALFRNASHAAGRHPPMTGLASRGYVAESDAIARDEFWPQYATRINSILRENGEPALSRERYERAIDERFLMVGGVEGIARRLALLIHRSGIERFDLILDTGNMPLTRKENAVRLLGTDVYPQVREMLMHLRAGRMI